MTNHESDLERAAAEWIRAYAPNKELGFGIEHIMAAYLAGAAEVGRYRDPTKEPPSVTGEYLVVMDDNDGCGPYHTSHLYSPDCGWSVQVGQSILGWMPLPLVTSPLPEAAK